MLFSRGKRYELNDTSRHNHMKHRCTHSPQTYTTFVLGYCVLFFFFYCTDSWGKYNNDLIVPIVLLSFFLICKIKLT